MQRFRDGSKKTPGGQVPPGVLVTSNWSRAPKSRLPTTATAHQARRSQAQHRQAGRLRNERSDARSTTAALGDLLTEVGGEVVEVERIDHAVEVEVGLCPNLVRPAEVAGQGVEVQSVDLSVEVGVTRVGVLHHHVSRIQARE